MAPPVKRRRRNIVSDDDDDEDDARDEKPTPIKNRINQYFSPPTAKSKVFGDAENEDDPSPPSPSSLRESSRPSRTAPAKKAPAAAARSSRFKSAASKNPGQSPSKPKANDRKPIDEKGKSANIRTLFSNQAQRAKAEPKPNGRSKKADVQAFDVTSDSLSDDEDISIPTTSGTSLVGQKAQKRSRDAFEFQPASTSTHPSTNAAQIFLRPSRLNSTSSGDGVDQRPWSERFGPLSLEELVVHKKKVADVRRWLDDVLSGRMRQRLLVLKGSAGTGKTTTMQLIAKDMGLKLLEWRNPTGSLGPVEGQAMQSASAQFEEFMGRGRKFGQLEFDEDNPTQTSVQDSQDDGRPRVIVVEEFPNTLMRAGSALTSFRRTILQYLANNTPSLAAFGHNSASESIIPVVLVISETLLTTTSASADSFTAHRLLGAEVLGHPGTAVIEFNDVAPTLLAKALELVVRKEARVSGRRRTPGPQVLKQLGEIGDIRSAISSLEFLCLKGDDADWGSKVAFSKTKKASKDQAMTKGEQKSLELISQREASLGIFHAVGKVVYNKRDEQPLPQESEEAAAEALPSYLSRFSRKHRSQVAVDSLIHETGTDASTFISALHENYALSCERTSISDPNSPIDYINGCIEYLSESDLMNPTRDIFFGGKGFVAGGWDQGSHILRQDEMAFEVAVRGLLFSLPCPVKRKSTFSGKGGDPKGAFKMYYPASIKLWRAKEELEGLVDLWSSKMLKGEDPSVSAAYKAGQNITNGASAFRRSKAGSVGDYVGNRNEQKYATKPPPGAMAQARGGEAAPLLSLGTSAREEMVLERLPYMAHMMRHRRTPLYSLGLRDMEKVVSFQGIGAPLDEEDEAEEGADEEAGIGDAAEGWATDKPTEGETPRKRRTAIRSRREQTEGTAVSSLQMHKLVLSDDDIEDED